jgi:phage-related protein (TIGR01555 family)
MANDNALTMAFDYASDYAQWGGGTEGIRFPGYPYLAELTQRPEYRRGAETIAREMTRKWIALEATGDADKSKKIKELDRALKAFRVQKVFRKIVEHDGFFGRSHIFVDLGEPADRAELATPLVLKAKVKKGCDLTFRVVEPYWCYPADYNGADPLRSTFFTPQKWYVQGVTIHHTRLLTFVGREVPDILKPAYMFGGLSLSQMAKPYVDTWLRNRQSVSDMLRTYSITVLKTDLASALSGSNSTSVLDRAALFTLTRDNQGLFLADFNKEEVANVSAPLGTLDHLLAQSQEQMAAVFATPLVILLGITPTGLNASSDGEFRAFYDHIAALQEHLFRDHLSKVIEIIQIWLWGAIDEDISFRFEPLWQLDEAGKAAVEKTKADTHAVYVDAGVIAPEEVREALAADDDSLYHGLDLSGPPPEPPEPPEDPETAGAGGEAKGESASEQKSGV